MAPLKYLLFIHYGKNESLDEYIHTNKMIVDTFENVNNYM